MENRSEALPGATHGSLPGAAERSEVSPRVATLAKEYRSCTLQPIAYVQSRSAHAKLDRKSAHAELDRNRALALVGNELEKGTFAYRCAPSDCLEGELSTTCNLRFASQPSVASIIFGSVVVMVTKALV